MQKPPRFVKPLESIPTQQERDAETIRKQSQHEDSLINNRLTWFSTLQGLLFTGLAFVWKEHTGGLKWVICTLGTVVAFSSTYASYLANQAHQKLRIWWHDNLKDYKGPSRVGFEFADETSLRSLMSPWQFVPTIFSLAWLIILCLLYQKDKEKISAALTKDAVGVSMPPAPPTSLDTAQIREKPTFQPRIAAPASTLKH